MGCDVSREVEEDLTTLEEKIDEDQSPWPVLPQERPEWFIHRREGRAVWDRRWKLVLKLHDVLKTYRDRKLTEQPPEIVGEDLDGAMFRLARYEPDQQILNAWGPVLLSYLSTSWLGNPTPVSSSIEFRYKTILGSLENLGARTFAQKKEDRERLERQAFEKLQTVAKERDRADAEELNAWHAKQNGEQWKALTSIKNINCVANQLECPEIKKLAQMPDFFYNNPEIGRRMGRNIGHVMEPLVSAGGMDAFRQLGAKLGNTDLPAKLAEVLKEDPKIKVLSVKGGPQKTAERCKAKREAYEKESKEDGGEAPRWANLDKHFKGCAKTDHGGRPRDKFYAGILDYARVSLTFEGEKAIVDAVDRISEKFQVVGLKNGMRDDFKPPPSGYRDVKLLVRFPLEREITVSPCQISPKGSPFELFPSTRTFPKGTTFICEVQLLHERYLQNKLTSSTRYKVRRATSWKALVTEFQKYIPRFRGRAE